jgi:hypothetical protein
MRVIQGVAVADELVREIRALAASGTTLDVIGWSSDAPLGGR